MNGTDLPTRDYIELRTERLVLSVPTARDIPAITTYCQDPLFEHLMTTPWPYTEGDAAYFVQNIVPTVWRSGVEFTWALRLAGPGGPGSSARDGAADAADLPLIGMIGYRVPTGDLGFWLGADHRGNGYMPEAVAAVAEWVFARGAASIGWECVVGNVASAAVARKSGFRFTGTRPSSLEFRDGSHPPAWHGVLGAPALRADLSPAPELPWPPESLVR